MGKLTVYTLGASGVIIDPHPLEPTLPNDALTSAINMVHDPKSAHGGGLRNRDGLIPFNPVTTGGIILGGAPMIVVGTAGAPVPTPGEPPGGPPGSPTGPSGDPSPGVPIFPVPVGKRGLIIGRRGPLSAQLGDTGWIVTSSRVEDPASLPIPVLPGPPGCMERPLINPSDSNGVWTGYPGFAIVQGYLYYAESHDATFNAVTIHGGVVSPTLHRTNGFEDHIIARLPQNPRLNGTPSSPDYSYDGQPEPSIVSILGVNDDTVYMSVLDQMPITAVPTARDKARVFKYSVTDATLIDVPLIDPTTDVGYGPGMWLELPFCMAWFADRLWLGGLGVGGGAVVWIINPNVDYATAKYSTSDMIRATVMLPFGDWLFVGFQAHYGELGTTIFHAPIQRFPLSLLGSPLLSLDPSVLEPTAQAQNGFISMVEFRSTLYASYVNGDGNSHIYKFISFADPDSGLLDVWTIVHTGSEYLTLAVDNDVLYAFGNGTGPSGSPVCYVSTDGTTFTDKYSTLGIPASNHLIVQLFGFDPGT